MDGLHDLTSFPTVFKSYQVNGQVVINRLSVMEFRLHLTVSSS